jgi:phosphatidylserine/phosphatidylglycerophosphate/cardiolipin synthase-like enzyme
MPRRRIGQRRVSTGVVILLLLGLMLVYFYRSGMLRELGARADQPATLAESRAPGADANDLQVFFTTPTLAYPDKPAQRPRSPLLLAVLADIDAARTSVDLASFDFDIVEVTNALLHARQRGVAVRLIVDSENLDTPEVSEQTGRLQSAGIPVHFDRREPFMHNKFIVVDSAIIWTGSWNVTTNDTFRNNNNMLRFASRAITADYSAEFAQMFAGRFGTSKTSATTHAPVRVGGARVVVYFSPEDGVAQYVLAQLKAAKTSIRFMTFSYTAAPIAAAMLERAQAGLTVRGVFETQNAAGTGAVFGRLKAGGVDVLTDGNCYILHHKVILIDEHIVITGSYNFTSSAERDNDENLVIIDDPALARAYLDEFQRVYAQAQTPGRCR